MAEGTSKRSINICGLCDEKESKYCCPRCEVYYCSLDCYKSEKHNDCSEDFYRDCVNEELTSHYADNRARRKVIDVLKSMCHARDGVIPEEFYSDAETDSAIDSDDEQEIDLSERIKTLDLDDPDAIWSALTKDEKNEFTALINEADPGSIISTWDPWWMYRREDKVIDLDNKQNPEEKALKKCPPLKAVPKLTALTSVSPSPVINLNIVNVIASYAYVMRYFNGEPEAVETTWCFLSICDNLNNNTNFDDLAIALESVAQKCLQNEEFSESSRSCFTDTKQDTFLIIQGPSKENNRYYCKSAISHLHEIFTQAKTEVQKLKEGKVETKKKGEFSKLFPDHSKQHLPDLDLGKLKKCIKKLEYYLSYLESYDVTF